ncbi:DnaB-like helicase N-terminal domain-containing protein [Sulfurimonas sp.]|jgi:replicative DNA helicase|uniref:DnaB-like helicase N-terminal domain-containing protein n=1 Tax=Sulfurimonas sp. TaxID=2022749 RepID=UPI0025E7753D|nr:DnaB-like helicase N-terminal domain-containing protein [Sulfurimonas sp.]MCK9473858.1 AAA family ATPase [Sulfurimonas sp.]
MNQENYNIYNINFEVSLLSSILFNPQLLPDIERVLNHDDFYLQAHQDIYSTIQYLYKNDLPIDEEFIKRKAKKFDEEAMLTILAANPISNTSIYAKEVKKDSISRRIHELSLNLQHKFDLDVIDKLQNLKFELENIDSVTTFKKNDKNIESVFDRFDIDFAKIEDLKFEYLMDHFLVKNEITMISARPGTGKSLLSVAAANMMLKHKTIEQVYYIDGDNSASTLKDRNIHHLKKEHGNNFRYFVGLAKSDLWKIVQTLLKMDLTNSLIVFDSIKNFINGDRDKNKDVSPVMEILKTLRNNGATVIFLHHQNKKQKDFESDYAGSSAFEEDASNAFKLTRNDDKNALILKPFKARSGDLHEMAFTYNALEHTLTKLDLEYAKQTEELDDMINETIEYLKSSRSKPMWSECWKNLTDLGYDKEKASKVIKNNEGKLWKFERGDRNNQKLYSLIETSATKSKVVETIYEDLVPRTPITPRTPDLGLYKESAIVSENSDNSENPKILNNLSIVENFPREKIEMPTL